MPDIQTLRKMLKDAQAPWSVAPEISDSTLIAELAGVYRLGALPVLASMPTTRLPRMRPDAAVGVIPAQPGVSRLLRAAVPRVPLVPARTLLGDLSRNPVVR